MSSPRRRARHARRVAFGLAAGLSLAACANTTTVAAWVGGSSGTGFTGTGGTVSILDEDLSGIAAGIRLHELKALHTVCAALATDASNGYSQLPTPDQHLTDLLNTAYTTLGNAAVQCAEAGSFSSPHLGRAKTELETGRRALDAAVTRVHRLGVR